METKRVQVETDSVLKSLPGIPLAGPDSTHSWFAKCAQFVYWFQALSQNLMQILYFIYSSYIQDETGNASTLETIYYCIFLIW